MDLEAILRKNWPSPSRYIPFGGGPREPTEIPSHLTLDCKVLSGKGRTPVTWDPNLKNIKDPSRIPYTNNLLIVDFMWNKAEIWGSP